MYHGGQAQKLDGQAQANNKSYIPKRTPYYTMKFERPSWDEYFMIQAELASLRSNCIVRKVGAVIAKGNRQLATGYNGTPPGIANCYENGCERCCDRIHGRIRSGEHLDKCMCTHAEANAIIHCAILGVNTTSGSTLYSTLSPCLECTKLAITIGVQRIVYMTAYSVDTQALIMDAGIKTTRMDKTQVGRWVNMLASTYRE